MGETFSSLEYQTPLRGKIYPLSCSLWLAAASFVVTLIGTALACSVWLPAFKVPPGKPSYRPMGQAFLSLVIGGGTTLFGLGLSIAAIRINPRRLMVWIIGVTLAIVSLAPFPVSRAFALWVFKVQGLQPAD